MLKKRQFFNTLCYIKRQYYVIVYILYLISNQK